MPWKHQEFTVRRQFHLSSALAVSGMKQTPLYLSLELEQKNKQFELGSINADHNHVPIV